MVLNKYLSPSYLCRAFPFIAVLFSIIALGITAQYQNERWPIRADGVGYYAYLPSYFIWRDPAMKKLHGKLEKLGYPSVERHRGWTGVGYVDATDRWLNKYNIGTAVLISPFFFIAHFLSLMNEYPAHGFSSLYQLAVGLAGATYLGIGLWALSRVLRREFSEGITFLTLVGITFGTNVFNYSFFDSSFSHIYSFALVAILLLLVGRFYSTPRWGIAATIGATVGLLCLVRCSNAAIASTVLLFWGVGNSPPSGRLHFLILNSPKFLLILLISLLTFSPQLLVWSYATGNFLVYSYGQEQLLLKFSPIWELLFSFSKGLFVWFPVLWLVPLGLIYSGPNGAKQRSLVLVHLALTLLLFASWHIWDLGGGFGHRGFVESMPILALAIAAAFTRFNLGHYRRPLLSFLVFSVALVTLNSFLYWSNLLPGLNLTPERYLESIVMAFQNKS